MGHYLKTESVCPGDDGVDLEAFESLEKFCVNLQGRGRRCGAAVDLFSFVEAVDVVRNEAFHHGPL